MERRKACFFLLAVLTTIFVVLLASCKPELTTEQKLEDFSYLFGILRDNHPYLDLKARVEGYNWLAHEKEFEDAIRAGRTDKEFAQAIQRMLLMINNGHTTIMSPQVYELIKDGPPEMVPWKDEAAKTDPETVNRWFSYAASMMQYPQGTSLPIRAWYCEGEYVVYWVSPELASKQGISLGDAIVTVDGRPVHEFVQSMRSLMRLKFDPSRRRLFMSNFFPPYTTKAYRIEFGKQIGTTIQVDVEFDKVSGSARKPYLPTNLGQSLPNVYTTLLGDGKVAYLHINQMASYESSEGWFQVLKEFYAKIKDVPSLIIDIRGNGGGDDRFWMLNVVRPLATKPLTMQNGGAVRTGEFVRPFLVANGDIAVEGVTGKTRILDKSDLTSTLTSEQVRNLPPEVLGPGFGDPIVAEMTIEPSGKYPYQGKVFLLVDSTVYSSSESFAQFCKATGWATVVGECTGGDGGTSTPAMGLNPDFTANEEMHTIPNVVAELSPEDLVRFVQAVSSGKAFTEPDPEYDTALKACLKLALEKLRSDI